jgi:hypothetical protein
VLAPLADSAFVAKVRVDPELGTVTWPGELDLDPVVLTCAVKGIPVPTDERETRRASKRVPRGKPRTERRRRKGA